MEIIEEINDLTEMYRSLFAMYILMLGNLFQKIFYKILLKENLSISFDLIFDIIFASLLWHNASIVYFEDEI